MTKRDSSVVPLSQNDVASCYSEDNNNLSLKNLNSCLERVDCNLTRHSDKSQSLSMPINLNSHFWWQKRKKAAFTLAEVLITLGIIGIVAAMTLPQLIKNYQAKVYETAFKKAYSNLSKAYLMTQQELGESNLRKAYATYDKVNNVYPLANVFVETFYKQLGAGVIAEKYMVKNYNNSYSFYTENLDSTAGWEVVRPQRILADGSSVGVKISGSNIHFYVDTNGPYRKPNRLGFDIFAFGVMDDQDIIKPYKQSHLYTEEELENQPFPASAGLPCSVHSKQKYNGYGCAYYAMNDINPDDNNKSYWKNLPK